MLVAVSMLPSQRNVGSWDNERVNSKKAKWESKSRSSQGGYFVGAMGVISTRGVVDGQQSGPRSAAISRQRVVFEGEILPSSDWIQPN